MRNRKPSTAPAKKPEGGEENATGNLDTQTKGPEREEEFTGDEYVLGTPGPKLVAKLCAVIAEIKQIEKTGFNSHHGYHYATESDIVEVLREKIAAAKIFIFPSQEVVTYRGVRREKENKVRVSLMTQVRMSYLITDGESSVTVHAFGQSEDGDDKGIYKAVTGATKYFHMKTFMIATGDDPERDSAERNGERADDRLPLPANGLIQDVVVSVSCETKQGGKSGTFVVCTVETAKYGKLECYESVGREAEKFAGTGTLCNMATEKSKYGPKLKSIEEVKMAPGEKEFNEVKAELAKATSLDQLSALKGKYKDMGGNFWTGDTVELFREAGIRLGAPTKKVTEEPKAETSKEPAASDPSPAPAKLSAFAETWMRRVERCNKQRDFFQLQDEFEQVEELKSSAECRKAITTKGAELGIEGYEA